MLWFFWGISLEIDTGPYPFKNDEILFPIQADSEKEVFTKLFHSIINHIEMTVKEQVFYPSTGADVHEH